MEMDWACFTPSTHCNIQSCSTLDSCWQEKQRKTEGNVEKNSGGRDEPTGLEMEHPRKVCQGPRWMEVAGWSLMC